MSNTDAMQRALYRNVL